MDNSLKKLGKIYESHIMNNNKTLASLVQDTLEWLLPIEDFEEAEDSCNLELEYLGTGRESVAYLENGVLKVVVPKKEQEKVNIIAIK